MLGGKWSKYCSLALFSTNHQKDILEKMWGWPWDGPPLAKMQKAINSRQILCILLAIPELKSPELAVLPPPEEPQKINPFSFEAFIMEIWDRIRPVAVLYQFTRQLMKLADQERSCAGQASISESQIVTKRHELKNNHERLKVSTHDSNHREMWVLMEMFSRPNMLLFWACRAITGICPLVTGQGAAADEVTPALAATSRKLNLWSKASQVLCWATVGSDV